MKMGLQAHARNPVQKSKHLFVHFCPTDISHVPSPPVGQVHLEGGAETLQRMTVPTASHVVAQDRPVIGVSAVFDRASLIALPPSMRSAYAAHMQNILASGAKTLLVTFDYPQHEMQGPPFSVEEPEVRALYENTGEVRLLYSANILDKEPRFRDKGITQLQEKVFHVTYNSR